MFGFIWKIFLELLTSIIIVFNHGKCVSLSNQKCTTQPTLINLRSNEYTQGLCCYPFAVNLDICIGGCNTFNGLSNRVCVLSEIEDLNMHVLNIITWINE